MQESIGQHDNIANLITCPFCEEYIHKNAAKCKHCGNNVKLYFKKLKIFNIFNNVKATCLNYVKKLNEFVVKNKTISIIALLIPIIIAVAIFYAIPKYNDYLAEEQRKTENAREMKVTNLSDYVSLAKTGHSYNTSTYKNPDSVYYTHEDNITYRHEVKGSYRASCRNKKTFELILINRGIVMVKKLSLRYNTTNLFCEIIS